MRSQGRIFVIKKNSYPPLDYAAPLLAALSGHGNAKLLVVAKAFDENLAGSARMLSKNLYAGYVSRFAAYDAADDICIKSWMEVLEGTYALCRQ